MKKSKLGYFLFCAVVFTGIAASSLDCAGVSGSVGVNISDQPVWGPTGYDRADYYYIPDIDSYYSVSERQYIYRDGSNWAHGASLPASYSNYDPYQSYKVVINEDKPYQNNDRNQVKYRTYKGHRDQPMIRDSQDRKYWVNKDHPEHGTWVREHSH